MHVSRFVLPGTNYDKERRFALGMGYPNVWDAATAALWVGWRCVCATPVDKAANFVCAHKKRKRKMSGEKCWRGVCVVLEQIRR